MNTAYLSLGSNEGDRVLWLNDAIGLISASCGAIIQKSSIYETAAWGINAQPDFLNMVVALQTTLTAEALLAAILNIETALGRQRSVKWGPRIIDIDILFFNDDVINTPDLIVPHPFLHKRRFTLIPLAEIAPTLLHPVLQQITTALLSVCEDTLEVRLFQAKA